MLARIRVQPQSGIGPPHSFAVISGHGGKCAQVCAETKIQVFRCRVWPQRTMIEGRHKVRRVETLGGIVAHVVGKKRSIMLQLCSRAAGLQSSSLRWRRLWEPHNFIDTRTCSKHNAQPSHAISAYSSILSSCVNKVPAQSPRCPYPKGLGRGSWMRHNGMLPQPNSRN